MYVFAKCSICKWKSFNWNLRSKYRSGCRLPFRNQAPKRENKNHTFHLSKALCAILTWHPCILCAVLCRDSRRFVTVSVSVFHFDLFSQMRVCTPKLCEWVCECVFVWLYSRIFLDFFCAACEQLKNRFGKCMRVGVWFVEEYDVSIAVDRKSAMSLWRDIYNPMWKKSQQNESDFSTKFAIEEEEESHACVFFFPFETSDVTAQSERARSRSLSPILRAQFLFVRPSASPYVLNVFYSLQLFFFIWRTIDTNFLFILCDSRNRHTTIERLPVGTRTFA